MAIDSAIKRRAAGGVPFLPMSPGVTPNASKPAVWRQQAGWGYSGVGSVVVVVYAPPITVCFYTTPGINASFSAASPDVSVSFFLSPDIDVSFYTAPGTDVSFDSTAPDVNVGGD